MPAGILCKEAKVVATAARMQQNPLFTGIIYDEKMECIDAASIARVWMEGER